MGRRAIAIKALMAVVVVGGGGGGRVTFPRPHSSGGSVP